MALPMLYSRRKRLADKTGDDVYQYDDMSTKLRQQIFYIINDWNSRYGGYNSSNPIFDDVVTMLREELGAVKLCTRYAHDTQDEFHQWLIAEQQVANILDGIELAVAYAAHHEKQGYRQSRSVADDIAVLNARMLEDGFGFQLEGGQIIEIGSTFIHKEVTVPALGLLSDRAFENANKEFRDAYQEFNQGNYDDCIHDCCNAFESVLKVILTKKGWLFDDKKDTAKKLLEIAFSNELIPSYMQQEFTGLRTILESGVPTVRNKTGGHGTGTSPRNIPKHIAAFQLHQTAAAIVLLVESAK